MTARTITITEALAELKTLDKRIAKKRESIGSYVLRQEALKDPLEKQGGSAKFIDEAQQAIIDLQTNIVKIRTEIQKINGVTNVTINGVTRSITEWLIWRRDVAPSQQQYLHTLRTSIDNVRKQQLSKGGRLVGVGVINEGDAKPTDIIVNIDEKALADAAETMETTLGTLDGLLSLKNATVTITV